MHLGHERPLFAASNLDRRGAEGRSRPRCLLHCWRQPRRLRHGRHKAPPAAPQRNPPLARTSTNRSVFNARSRRRAFRWRAAARRGTQLPSLCSPVFRQSKSNSPATRGWTRVCGGEWDRGYEEPCESLRGSILTRTAFVNRQERASLDVLTMRFECPGDDARGAI
jgi:hypothetical protein